MATQNVTFKNKNDDDLIGKIQWPETQHPKAYAIFAHCFTCGKNLKVIRELSSAIAALGIAVLRFDFTGLGQSEGEFENTNFSHDVEDLISAAKFLEKNYEAPSLIIGHSLGGTAALFASEKLESIKAMVTIGSPSQPSHVSSLIKEQTNSEDNKNEVVINLGGKDFTIKKHFLDDIYTHDTATFLGNLKISYLILHSPQDQIVGIENAEELYRWAHHPKSFISLDKADHLLNKNTEAEYVGKLIGQWAVTSLQLPKEDNLAMSSKHQSAAVLHKKDKFLTHLKIGDFGFYGDEPKDFGGDDFGPAPYDFISAALAECTAMTLHMYARHKKWALDEVRVHINHQKKKVKDNNKTIKMDHFNKQIEIQGDLDEKQKERLLEIGDRCPIHKTLHSDVKITSELVHQK